MGRRGSKAIDPILERTFGWLRELGFTATVDSGMTVGAAFASDTVVVRPTYHWHDEFTDITIARRSTPEPGPYWAEVHLEELLEHTGATGTFDSVARNPGVLEGVFAHGAALLRQVAADQLAGRNLELLDEIIAKRPRRGVPGLDFPVAEAWASSQEGLWFATDFSGPPVEFGDAMAASAVADPIERATAALRLRPGVAEGPGEEAAGFGRLVELLSDPDVDVRRAAASSLSDWGEISVLGPILDLLDGESGEAASPFAAAATFLAIWQAPELRTRVRDALDAFAARGEPSREQVAQLRWRLDD